MNVGLIFSIRAVFALLGAIFFWQAAAAVNPDPRINIFQGLGRATLFKHSDKYFSEYRFISGPINYRVDEKVDQEGYLPVSTLDVKGTFREHIHDYTARNTALELAREVSKRLQDSGYAVEFQCEKHYCGDVQAWQLYLSPYVDGQPESQYYFLAKKPISDTAVHQVAIYINEFTGIPRTIVHEVMVSAPKPDPTLNLPESDAKELEQVLFEFNSARINAAGKKKLRRLVSDLQKSSDALLIVGHADERGSEDYNDALSKSRAEAVQQFLTQSGLDRSRVFLRGDGERFAPSVDEAAAKRRVDIFQVVRTP